MDDIPAFFCPFFAAGPFWGRANQLRGGVFGPGGASLPMTSSSAPLALEKKTRPISAADSMSEPPIASEMAMMKCSGIGVSVA